MNSHLYPINGLPLNLYIVYLRHNGKYEQLAIYNDFDEAKQFAENHDSGVTTIIDMEDERSESVVNHYYIAEYCSNYWYKEDFE